MLSEVSHTRRDKYCMISLTCGICKNKTTTITHQKTSKQKRSDLWSPAVLSSWGQESVMLIVTVESFLHCRISIQHSYVDLACYNTFICFLDSKMLTLFLLPFLVGSSFRKSFSVVLVCFCLLYLL